MSTYPNFANPPDEEVNEDDTQEYIDKTDVLDLYCNFLSRGKWLILLLSIIFVWPMGYYSFKHLNEVTDSSFSPTEGSLSALAEDAFANNYPHDLSNPSDPGLWIVLESRNGSMIDPDSHMYSTAKSFYYELQDTFKNTCWKVKSDNACQLDNPKISITTFFSLAENDLDMLARSMVTPNGDTMLVEIDYMWNLNVTHVHKRLHQLEQVVLDYIADNNKNSNFQVSYTGLPFFAHDLSEATKVDLRRMDMISLPISLLLLGVVLPRVNFGFVSVIPLFTMITTVSLWSIVMYFFVAPSMQITQMTPNLMMSLTLGMGIDYTLFLLSRYVEDLNIQYMIYHGGAVVLWSGTALLCSFLGLYFLPFQMLQSIGVGAAVAIISSLIVNLVFVPTLLHTSLGKWIIRLDCIETEEQQEEEDDSNWLSNAVELQTESRENEGVEIIGDSFWNKLARQILHPYKSIIIFLVILQLLIPTALYARKMETSISFDLLLPASSPSYQVFQNLGKKFGMSRLAPYRILFDSHNANMTMTSHAGFELMHTVVNVLNEIHDVDTHNDLLFHDSETERVQEVKNTKIMDEQEPSIPLEELTQRLDNELNHNSLRSSNGKKISKFEGIAVANNVPIPYPVYKAAKLCGVGSYQNCKIKLLRLLDYIDRRVTSHDHHATYIIATLGLDAFSSEGIAWLQSARNAIEKLEQEGILKGVEIHISGTAAIAIDTVSTVMNDFPMVIILSLSTVFFLMVLCFRSIVAPLRSVITIAMTLGFSFGATVWFFSATEICWLVPIMGFSIIVGLALDYDVFLVSRIWEYRLKTDHFTSIVNGLGTTGSIITAAGGIMATAFGGFLLSSCPVLLQWSFLMTSAVLFDTMVVRTLVVPILFYWLGANSSWWPRNIESNIADESSNVDESSIICEDQNQHNDSFLENDNSSEEPLLQNSK